MALSHEPDVLTEVPSELKKLAQCIVRGFYTIEHALVIDLLVRNSCIKEDDLASLLKFDKKQLRTLLNQLKNDKLIKQRLKVETQVDGRSSRHNYYFINYQLLVNVVKYRLERMRQKLEVEQRDATCKASFKCFDCAKTFSDFDAQDLCDPLTGQLKCTYCGGTVDEDLDAAPKKDLRALVANFNKQMEPFYQMLSKIEDIKLDAAILQPEPINMDEKTGRAGAKGFQPNAGHMGAAGSLSETWSGDATRNRYSIYDQTVTINMSDDTHQQNSKDLETVKERPAWLLHSTVDVEESMDQAPVQPAAKPSSSSSSSSIAATAPTTPATAKQPPEEIMNALLAHEKRSGGASFPGGSKIGENESSSSDSEDEDVVLGSGATTATTAVVTTSGASSSQQPMSEEEEENEEEEVMLVSVGGQSVSFDEITDEIIAKMTPSEKEAYIKMGQEAYAAMYE